MVFGAGEESGVGESREEGGSELAVVAIIPTHLEGAIRHWVHMLVIPY